MSNELIFDSESRFGPMDLKAIEFWRHVPPRYLICWMKYVYFYPKHKLIVKFEPFQNSWHFCRNLLNYNFFCIYYYYSYVNVHTKKNNAYLSDKTNFIVTKEIIKLFNMKNQAFLILIFKLKWDAEECSLMQ